jgi:hypothetical protein
VKPKSEKEKKKKEERGQWQWPMVVVPAAYAGHVIGRIARPLDVLTRYPSYYF